jgi:drug/metabolite transporter (DMT)-like permease
MKWLLVALVVAATAGADLLQSWGGKRQGEVASAADLGRLMAKWPILLAFACMAVSFFSFLALLRIADLSFAVPATAATVVLETALARLVLGEAVEARRWGGSLLVTLGIVLLAQS